MPSISISLIGSEADLLRGLWQASLLLALLSLAVAFGLILRRCYQDMRARRRDRRRAKLSRVLWGALAAPVVPSLENLPALKDDDAMLVCDLALDILRPLRGEEAARIVGLLDVWPVRAHLRRMLAKGRRSGRIRMLTLLAHFDDAETLDILKQWIGDTDFYVQLAALRSLAARNAVETLPDILAHLVRAERQNTTMLADVLRRFGEPALDMLIKLAAGKNAHLEVRFAAIKAVEAIGSIDAALALVALAADPLADIRAPVVAALGRLGDIRAEQAVLHALDDNAEAVRVRAARAAVLT